MSVPLYFDHHIKKAITEGLRKRGVDVLTCLDDGAEQWDDDKILDRATQLGRAVFTQDDDFLVLANKPAQFRRRFRGRNLCGSIGYNHRPSRS